MSTTQDYDFRQIEAYWQDVWEKQKPFQAIDFDERPPYYILDMFPYPSGAGLHIGHPEGYTATDILGRYKKACGYNVLHPMGWDAFGLPAEQHAIATGTPPAENTRANINRFRQQIKRLGFGLDWDREVDTTDPTYYRWTQWIFLKLFQRGLAYVDEKPIWWCEALGTALANEEIIDGRSERGNHPVERKNLRQWVLRITRYADKLIEHLEHLDWPDSTKRQQIAWIGRSEGVELVFNIENHPDHLSVYTTRLDTLYGVSFLAIAPEHPCVEKITTSECWPAIQAYIEAVQAKSDLARTDLAKEKTGVFTGAYALNPINGERIPIWVADYVLFSYASGVVMGVPAHDERDFEFARQYHLPIVQVLKKGDDPTAQGTQTALPYTQSPADSVLIASGPYTGLNGQQAIPVIADTLAQRGCAQHQVQYKLRDWLFSRQRYWGEPFPIVWVSAEDFNRLKDYPNSPWLEFMPKEPVCFTQNGETRYALPLPSAALPLKLPHVEQYQVAGTGESPLACVTDWLHIAINLKTGEVQPAIQPRPTADWVVATRETNTMPQWAGSCWYYLRYLDPKNAQALVDPKIEQYWGAPAYYVGGAEHAVLHLLYARFWHRFLYEEGVVSTPEPFPRLFHQGIILGEDGSKMSKSKGNTIDPDDIIRDYGADALRLYEMFLGPLEDMKPWSTRGIEGVFRFLKRLFREVVSPSGSLNPKIAHAYADTPDLLLTLHTTIKKVTQDIETLRFNTAIAQLMVCLNHIQEQPGISHQAMSSFIQLVAPFAPHLAQELWAKLGYQALIVHASWPAYDESLMVQHQVELVVQVLGKVKGHLMVDIQATQADVIAKAQALPSVQASLSGKSIVKTIYVPGKIINFVLAQA